MDSAHVRLASETYLPDQNELMPVEEFKDEPDGLDTNRKKPFEK